MENTWTIESMDISGVGRAPSVEFIFAPGLPCKTITANPPGGAITIVKLPDGTNSVNLTNTLTNALFADIDVRHVPTESVDDQWNDETTYVCEVAAALYWSMWRMQQIKAAAARKEEP